jgi:hypothetical protein
MGRVINFLNSRWLLKNYSLINYHDGIGKSFEGAQTTSDGHNWLDFKAADSTSLGSNKQTHANVAKTLNKLSAIPAGF